MKEEKQTGIVVSGNPYREAGIITTERKLLSEQQARNLVDIVSSNKDVCIPQLTFGKKSYSFTRMLTELGYEKQVPREEKTSKKLYIKHGNFYLVAPPYFCTKPVYERNVSLVSGTTYGNIDEAIGNSERYVDFCDLRKWISFRSPPKRTGIVEFLSSIFRFESDFNSSLRAIFDIDSALKSAMSLPVEFASYQYGLEARAKLRDEFKQLLKTK